MILNYKVFGSGFPLVILHGLLGSLDNWQTIARKMVELSANTATPLQIFIVDQRNHGKSPHTDDMNYDLLSNDLRDFFEQHNISKAHIIGHSMGGKAAMKFALKHPDKLEKLVVVDISPSQAEDHHTYIFEALDAANVAEANSREQVQEVLNQRIGDDLTTIQFLMKGLQRDPSEKHFEWKFNLPALWNHYPDVMEGVIGGEPYKGQCLFIKGGKSNYINAGNYPEIADFFPNNELVEITGAGHWVQAEKPAEFIATVMEFLTGSNRK